MQKCYVVARCETLSGHEDIKNIMDTIKSYKNVTNVSGVYGVYDMMIEVGYADNKELWDIVTNKIRKTPGLAETMTVFTKE